MGLPHRTGWGCESPESYQIGLRPALVGQVKDHPARYAQYAGWCPAAAFGGYFGLQHMIKQCGNSVEGRCMGIKKASKESTDSLLALFVVPGTGFEPAQAFAH